MAFQSSPNRWDLRASAALLPCLVIVLCMAAIARGREPAASVPAALAVPAGNEVEVRFSATGVQIYRCQPSVSSPSDLVWSFVAPDATLFDREGNVAGRHYAGPTWEANDGSKILGKVIGKAAAPDGTSIPWLLLSATVIQQGETFERIDLVQRLRTNGGSAPATGCSHDAANTELRVPYTAEYLFYSQQ